MYFFSQMPVLVPNMLFLLNIDEAPIGDNDPFAAVSSDSLLGASSDKYTDVLKVHNRCIPYPDSDCNSAVR